MTFKAVIGLLITLMVAVQVEKLIRGGDDEGKATPFSRAQLEQAIQTSFEQRLSSVGQIASGRGVAAERTLCQTFDDDGDPTNTKCFVSEDLDAANDPEYTYAVQFVDNCVEAVLEGTPDSGGLLSSGSTFEDAPRGGQLRNLAFCMKDGKLDDAPTAAEEGPAATEDTAAGAAVDAGAATKAANEALRTYRSQGYEKVAVGEATLIIGAKPGTSSAVAYVLCSDGFSAAEQYGITKAEVISTSDGATIDSCP